MSSVDVGDAVELTFATVTGSTVTVTWYDPDQVAVTALDPVTETPAGSGQFPRTFVPDAPGVWTAEFTASGAATAVERYYVRARPASVLPPLATVGDVSDQFGPLTSAQETLTVALLRAASALIRARYPATDALLAGGGLDPDLVALAATNMVLRVLRNPGGLRSETVGPFSRSYDTTHAAGLLVLTEDEAPLLVPPVSVTALASPIGTIMLKPGLAPPPTGLTHAYRW